MPQIATQLWLNLEALTVYKIIYSGVDGKPEITCKCLKKLVGANGFEPSTSWSRTSGQNHISRCPGVTYWFSGRSLMDKSGQAITECSRELWGIDSKAARPGNKFGFGASVENADGVRPSEAVVRPLHAYDRTAKFLDMPDRAFVFCAQLAFPELSCSCSFEVSLV